MVRRPGDRDDLLGGFRAPRRFIGWTTFFKFPAFAADLRPNKRIDTHLSSALLDLPLFTIAECGDDRSAVPHARLPHIRGSRRAAVTEASNSSRPSVLGFIQERAHGTFGSDRIRTRPVHWLI